MPRLRHEDTLDSMHTKGVCSKMKRLAGFAVLAALVAVVVGGCAPIAKVLGSGGGTPGAAVDLDGTRWTLTQLNGQPVDGTGEGTLDFTVDTQTGDRRVSGVAFCNRFSGPYEQNGSELTFGPLMRTLMACREDAGPEGEYLTALAAVASARLDGEDLVLSNASGDDLLVFVPAKQAGLEGTLWTLTGYATSAGGISSVMQDTEITATFANGAVQGTGGCNSYSGPYTLDGSSLTFGSVARTEMACMTPDGVMAQEDAYFNNLAAVGSFAIERNALTLYDAGGAVVLTFVAAGE